MCVRKRTYLKHSFVDQPDVWKNLGVLTNAEIMAQAIRMSIENVGRGGGPFAAIVARGGEIIASGVNQVTVTNDPTAHAEIVAIRAACHKLGSFQLPGCDFFTTCEPCPMCMGAIYWARPSCVYFANSRRDAADIGFDDSFIYDELARPTDARRIPMQQFMRDEALAAFRAWQSATEKIPY
jgi:tRNA(Arg) A34 adenosine deaminase TadA